MVCHRLDCDLGRLRMRIHYGIDGAGVSACGKLAVPLNADMEFVTCLRCNPTLMKPCAACGETKPLESFYRHKRTSDGHVGRCKACWGTQICEGCGRRLRYDNFKYKTSAGRVRKFRMCDACRYGRRHMDNYGDRSFPGFGILKCTLCGNPYRDHPIARPCPYVGEMVA